MRKGTQREAKISDTLPKVWKDIIAEPNDILVDLLIEETERACGYKPDESTVKSFLGRTQSLPPPPSSLLAATSRRGSGSLIYVPEINSDTYLHFSWDGESCALRDYSHSSTLKPKADRRFSTSYIRARITEEVRGDGRNRNYIEHWHQKTLEVNRRIRKS